MLIGKPHNDIFLLETTSNRGRSDTANVWLLKLIPGASATPKTQTPDLRRSRHITALQLGTVWLRKIKPLCAANLTPRNRRTDTPSASYQVRKCVERIPWAPLMLCVPLGLWTLAQSQLHHQAKRKSNFGRVAMHSAPLQPLEGNRATCTLWALVTPPERRVNCTQIHCHVPKIEGYGNYPWKWGIQGLILCKVVQTLLYHVNLSIQVGPQLWASDLLSSASSRVSFKVLLLIPLKPASVIHWPYLSGMATTCQEKSAMAFWFMDTVTSLWTMQPLGLWDPWIPPNHGHSLHPLDHECPWHLPGPWPPFIFSWKDSYWWENTDLGWEVVVMKERLFWTKWKVEMPSPICNHTVRKSLEDV